MDDTNYEEMDYERAKVFCERQLVVHISKKNGGYYNGVIVEVKPDFFFIDDREDGKQLVFFKELKKPIETYTEEGKT